MNLIWKQNATILKSATINLPAIFPVTFPAETGNSQTLTLASSGPIDGTFSTLQNVQLYLQGDPDQIHTLLNVWPNYGNASVPPRPDLNGGFEISWDMGYSFQRLGSLPTGERYGFQSDPSTWLTLPAICIMPGAQAGTLGTLDVATISVRYVVPPLANQFEIFTVRLEASFDVV